MPTRKHAPLHSFIYHFPLLHCPLLHLLDSVVIQKALFQRAGRLGRAECTLGFIADLLPGLVSIWTVHGCALAGLLTVSPKTSYERLAGACLGAAHIHKTASILVKVGGTNSPNRPITGKEFRQGKTSQKSTGEVFFPQFYKVLTQHWKNKRSLPVYGEK